MKDDGKVRKKGSVWTKFPTVETDKSLSESLSSKKKTHYCEICNKPLEEEVYRWDSSVEDYIKVGS